MAPDAMSRERGCDRCRESLIATRWLHSQSKAAFNASRARIASSEARQSVLPVADRNAARTAGLLAAILRRPSPVGAVWPASQYFTVRSFAPAKSLTQKVVAHDEVA